MALPAHAQTAPAAQSAPDTPAASGFAIQDIRVEGLKRIEPGTLFAYLPFKRGDTFTDDKAS
ncbi:outer membrane protein assembly complex, YaeT protein, partial [Burkholderia sp. TJI49]